MLDNIAGNRRRLRDIREELGPDYKKNVDKGLKHTGSMVTEDEFIDEEIFEDIFAIKAAEEIIEKFRTKRSLLHILNFPLPLSNRTYLSKHVEVEYLCREFGCLDLIAENPNDLQTDPSLILGCITNYINFNKRELSYSNEAGLVYSR